MDTRTFHLARSAAWLFMAAVVAVSLWLNNPLLAGAGLLTGLLFLGAARAGATLFLIALYAISVVFFNRRYGGGNGGRDEE